MSSHAPRLCPGIPAAWCRSIETALSLPGLVDALQAEQPYLVWLDSARRHRLTGRFSVLGWDPWLTFCGSGDALTLSVGASMTKTRGNPLGALRQMLARYPGPRGHAVPPVGVGFLGFFSYELNRWIERLPPSKPADPPVPAALWCGMRMLVVVDHVENRSWCLSLVDPHRPRERAVREAAARLEGLEELLRSVSSAEPAPPLARAGRPSSVEPMLSQPQFEALVHRAKTYIQAGDIFQANLSQRFHALRCGSPWPLYLTLRRINPSPFACFMQWPDGAVVSCSPERLVQVRDGLAAARPIAGTRPRGMTPGEDAVNSLELVLSDKERAEHIMLVDLARNDLGRVCRAGSVRVDELMALEDYSHVIHLVSNVRGRLERSADAVDVIRALFPGGTITGCPKVRCMEIIHELEPVGRGLYTGSAGYVGFDGSMDLNILIRTMIAQGDRVSFHVGAGIVADSQPDREYHETLAKAGALLKALQPITDRAMVHKFRFAKFIQNG